MGGKIWRNSLLFAGAQILARGIGFLYFIFLARALPVEEFGSYAWILGFVYNFYPLADFGLERWVMREVARRPKKISFYLARLLPLRFLLGWIGWAVCLLLAWLIGVGGSKLFWLSLFGLSLPLTNLVFLLVFAKAGLEEVGEYVKATLAIPCLAAIFGVGVVWLNAPKVLLYLTFVFALGAVWLWLMVTQRRLLTGGWQVDFSFWRKVMAQAAPLAVLLTLSVFYLRLPLILIGRLLGDYWAGIYGAAGKFIEAGILLPASLALALFPLSSRLLWRNRKKMRRLYWRTLGWSFVASLPVLALMAGGGQFVIPLIYGGEYQPAVAVFRWAGVLMVFFFVNSLAGNVIQNSKKLVAFVPFALSNFLLALLAGLILIPHFGAVGGVWSLIIGEIYGFLINNYFVWRILNE